VCAALWRDGPSLPGLGSGRARSERCFGCAAAAPASVNTTIKLSARITGIMVTAFSCGRECPIFMWPSQEGRERLPDPALATEQQPSSLAA